MNIQKRHVMIVGFILIVFLSAFLIVRIARAKTREKNEEYIRKDLLEEYGKFIAAQLKNSDYDMELLEDIASRYDFKETDVRGYINTLYTPPEVFPEKDTKDVIRIEMNLQREKYPKVRLGDLYIMLYDVRKATVVDYWRLRLVPH